MRLKILVAALAIGVAAIGGHDARAQSYPTRPIKLIAPFPAGGPVEPPGARGSGLIHLDEGVRRMLARLTEHDDGFDVAAAEAAWDACLAAPDWDRDPVWIHGDLQPGNLIVEEAGGRCSTFDGPAPTSPGSFLTTNGLVHDEAVAMLATASS